MPINVNEMISLLLEGVALPLIDVRDRQKTLDRLHTRFFLEEFAARYPQHQHNNPAVSEAFITRAIAAINQNPRITPAVVAAAVGTAEGALGLAHTARPAPPAPQTPAEHLVAWLDQRQGNFTWQGEPEQNAQSKLGVVSDFRTWLGNPGPLANPPGANTRMICWEVVLLAAASVQIYTVAQLQTAYAGNLLNGVFTLFTTHGVQQINRHAQSGFNVPNQIPRGNIIMIQSTAANIDHVVVVATPNPANISQIEVLSLWNTGTGGVLGRTPLDPLLFEAKTIRYATL
ncbi:hypothetical protein I6A60_15625 [Frankia sp. AgB1.9]|uniref:hypothetical protein n=1 Tax=unclassified Frankia TaxID=2632575 RepID=UPI0019323C64|nr:MULTISPECIES: hypothetical protein [unclassified Frankia]MBL7492768.1 hypothetical protein [Frankia sp. AgW1.1]MBL7549302.1 hypothetical protein [Frankia sp. AgB1.9]MBL7619231.1 hypothetical protein [Frankia sp. AgB1.8]